MWFVIGVIVGYWIDRAFKWMDRTISKNTESIFVEEYDNDRPRGAPITFDEWKKRNGI